MGGAVLRQGSFGSFRVLGQVFLGQYCFVIELFWDMSVLRLGCKWTGFFGMGLF